MLSPKKIIITLYTTAWFILTCLISTPLYAFYYKIFYKNIFGEDVSFYIKTNAFKENMEVGLNINWLQGHSTFSSFNSLTITGIPRYRVERVRAADTLGQFVFNIRGGPDIGEGFPVDPSEALARATLPALQMIESELAHSDIQDISSVHYDNRGGDQHDVYVHIIAGSVAAVSLITEQAASLADDLMREGIISAWWHRSRIIQQPEEQIVTLVLSGLFTSSQSDDLNERSQQAGAEQYDSNRSFRINRLNSLLSRMLREEWNGCNALAFQRAYSGSVYISLTAFSNEHERMFYDSSAIRNFATRIESSGFSRTSSDLTACQTTAAQWPPFCNSGVINLSPEYRRVINNLLRENLLTVSRNFSHGRQNWHAIQYFLITSVLTTPPAGDLYGEYFSQRSRAIMDDILRIRRHVDTSGLNLELRFINIEDGTGSVHINYMLASYITNPNQSQATVQQVQNLYSLTSLLTRVRRWQPVSISVQQHNFADEVVPIPLSDYFSLSPELADRSPATSGEREGIPLKFRAISVERSSVSQRSN